MCPASVAGLPFSGSTYGLQPGSATSSAQVDCHYTKLRKGKPAISIGIRASWFPKEASLNMFAIYDSGYCWAIHGQKSEPDTRQPNAGIGYPVGDRFIQSWWSASNAKQAKKAKAAARDLAQAMAPRAILCPANATVDAVTGYVDPHVGDSTAIGGSPQAIDPNVTSILLTGAAAQQVLDAGRGAEIALYGDDDYGVVVRDDGSVGTASLLGGSGTVEDLVVGGSGDDIYVLVTVRLPERDQVLDGSEGQSGQATGQVSGGDEVPVEAGDDRAAFLEPAQQRLAVLDLT